MYINATNSGDIEYTIEAKPFFASHVNYVYVTPNGQVMLRQPLWSSPFGSLQFIVAVRSRLNPQVSCTTDVTMAIRRNLYPPVVVPGQRTLSKYFNTMNLHSSSP